MPYVGGWAAWQIFDLLDASGNILAALGFVRQRSHTNVNTDQIVLYTTLGTTTTAHAPTSWDLTLSADSITASGSGWSLTAAFSGTPTQVQARSFVSDASGLDAPTATVSTDDISVYLASGTAGFSDEDTASLTGIDSGWLTNTSLPELAVEIEPPGGTGDLLLTDVTRGDTNLKSTAVQLDIEGSNDVLTVVTGPRKRETWDMEILSLSEAGRRSLIQLLANNASVSLRLPDSLDYFNLDDGFYAVGDVSTTRLGTPRMRTEHNTVLLPLTPSRGPSFDVIWAWNWDALAQTGLSWDEVVAEFTSWDDLLLGPDS